MSRREEREVEIRTSESVRCVSLAGSRHLVPRASSCKDDSSHIPGMRAEGMRQEPLDDMGFWKAGQCGHLGEPLSGVHGCRCARVLERLCTSRECFRPREKLSRVGWNPLRRLSAAVEHPETQPAIAKGNKIWFRFSFFYTCSRVSSDNQLFTVDEPREWMRPLWLPTVRLLSR